MNDGVLKSMNNVQAARDIGRWDHDAIGRAVALRSEISVLFPNLIPSLFDRVGVVRLVHDKSGCVDGSIGMRAGRRADGLEFFGCLVLLHGGMYQLRDELFELDVQ